MTNKPAHRPVREEITPQQLRFIQLKCDSNMNNRQIAEIVGVHPNTIYNWGKSDLVREEMRAYVNQMRDYNMVKSQRLMGNLLDKANDIIQNDEVGLSHKVQLIGQLFTQCGKFAGLEPVKESKKTVEVKKSGIEQMISAEYSEVV